MTRDQRPCWKLDPCLMLFIFVVLSDESRGVIGKKYELGKTIESDIFRENGTTQNK